MAQTPQQQRSIHPLTAYNFKVTVDGVDMRFARVSGLAREYQTVTYRHGLSFREGEQIYKHYVERYASITLEQGTIRGDRFLSDWLDSTTPSAMQINLCDETGTPTVAWSVAKALPVKLTAVTFDAASNELSIDSLEVRVAGVSIKHLG